MANALYDRGRQSFLAGQLAWASNTIRVALVDTGAYTANLATDQFFSSVPVGARVAVSGALTSKTEDAGVADAADVTLPSVSGSSVEAIVIYQDTGADATSRLIAFIDTAVGLPLLPNGGNVTITWDSGPNKIFKL